MKIPHPNHPEGGYYMEDDLYKNLVPLLKRIEKDKDVVAVYVGSPGDGKSTKAQQDAYLLDPNLSLSNIHWSYEDYVLHSLRLKEAGKSKGTALIHDEGKETLSSASMLNLRTKKFMQYLYENRSLNMFQFLLSGDFFDLPRTLVMQRVLYMVYVHEEGEFQNGYFKFYNRDNLRKLYLKGKAERDMKAYPYNLRGTFPKFYTVDEAAYRKKKADDMVKDKYIVEKKKDRLGIKDILYWLWDRRAYTTDQQVMDITGIWPSQYFSIKKQYKLQESKEII